ncbi:FMN-dependent NADH-azoreductase [Microbacterium soli]|uniref:NAD(P)H-dependent oxidoreductase n=1 Tax=Microbacterium soli TaxID=446075 RepID=A0ABP7MVL6_9MICO
MTLLRIDASIHPHSSATRELGDIVEAEWTSGRPDALVRRRDLTENPVRFESWRDAVTGGMTPQDQRTAAQRDAIALAESLADELISATALLFDFPLYNYGVAQHVKSWFDMAYTDPRIDPAGSALRGKPAVLVTALGGNYDEGTPKHGWDHSTPWIRRVLEDVWGLELQVVQRSYTLVGVNPALDRFADAAAAHRTESLDSARRLGRELVQRATATVAAA